MAKSSEETVVEKLDKILRVLSLQVAPERSITERARLLKLAGLSNQEIANVLNISSASVATLTTKLKKK